MDTSSFLKLGEGSSLFILVYVDDILITRSDASQVQQLNHSKIFCFIFAKRNGGLFNAATPNLISLFQDKVAYHCQQNIYQLSIKKDEEMRVTFPMQVECVDVPSFLS
ncbi:Uncharacterized protein Adt_29093 [Abeliophyllum distichum]|uniref:Reverse transcriptase Ty1/copia-type domain-containing protein n=1 Tax=Abeliophyllum distichum TaxID=126358 RepID=A0ABD1RYE4_9LAMI